MNGKEVKFLYLSEPDMIKAGVLDMKKCIMAVEESFVLLSKGDYLMGGPSENDHGHLIWFPKKRRFPGMPIAGPDRRFMAMIAYLGGRFNVCGEKWYGSNIENTKVGLPRSIHTVILNDAETSEPLVIMSGNLLSQMRTGAVPGVISKNIAKKDAKTVGLIGCGIINRTSLMGIVEASKTIEKVKVYDIFENNAKAFANQMSESLNLKVEVVSSIKKVIEGSDIVNIAASGEKLPEVNTNWLQPGGVLILIGAANFVDIDWYKKCTMVADNWKLHKVWIDEIDTRENGFEEILSWAPSAPFLKCKYEGLLNDDDVIDLGDIVSRKANINTSGKKKIIVATGGMVVEDMAFAYDIYKQAIERGIGQELLLWNKHYWM